MIDDYSFGRIVIDGVVYTSDVIICPGQVNSWWREEGHLLQEKDLSEVLAKKPEVLVIGTGAYGMMKVTDALRKKLADQEIEVIVEKTPSACTKYNELIKTRKVIAALHLTC